MYSVVMKVMSVWGVWYSDESEVSERMNRPHMYVPVTQRGHDSTHLDNCTLASADRAFCMLTLHPLSMRKTHALTHGPFITAIKHCHILEQLRVHSVIVH